MTPERPDREAVWARHDAEWRHPAQVVSQWAGAERVEPRLLAHRASGAWWDVVERLGICLLVTREYEHLALALCVDGGRPRVSFLPVPHPSGIAVDRAGGTVFLASTRNPNQVFDLVPVTRHLARRDSRAPDIDANPLVPVRARYFPGSLYLHELAIIGRRLHGNAVGHNAVVRLEPGGTYRRVWWPRSIEVAGGPEFGKNHLQLNSIAAGPTLSSSFFSASAATMSARRPGHRNFPVDRRGVVFSGKTREPLAGGLTRPHSARLHDGRLWVDDSGYGSLAVLDGDRFEPVARLPGWTRGLMFRDGYAFVGTSRVIPRFRQYAPGLDVDASVCGVHAVDVRSGDVVGSLTWPDGNQIFSVEWLPVSMTRGFPFLAGRRAAASASRALFYSFTNGADPPSALEAR